MRVAWIWRALTVVSLAGCSPTYNWREVRPEGAPLRAMLPCKPDRAERALPLLGPQAAAVPVWMLSCTAGGHRFALAAARLPDGVPAARVLRDWRLAAWASLQQAPADALAGASDAAPPGWSHGGRVPAGATLAQHWQGPGVDVEGHALRAEFMLAARERWLVQLAVYGPGLGPESRATLFEGLGFD